LIQYASRAVSGRNPDILRTLSRNRHAPALLMTYEEYLDEVTTLMTELFDMSDADAIKHVMRAQAADFFTLHDDLPEMRTQERAEQDAKTIFEQRNKSRPHVAPKRSGKPGK
jgi:hypothetical protein